MKNGLNNDYVRCIGFDCIPNNGTVAIFLPNYIGGGIYWVEIDFFLY